MRTPVTMGPIPFGFYMCISLVLYFYFSRLNRYGNKEYGGSILIPCILTAGLVFSGSRGAWMTAILIFALILIMHRRLKPFRPIMAFSTVIALVFAPKAIDYLATNDPYGTFQYRIDLFFNSLATIKDSFFLGSKIYLEHPAMQASMQGQGIIDIVNSYVGIALAYGVPMLLLLVFVIFNVIGKLVTLRKSAESISEKRLLEWQTRVTLALITGGFVMIITVSLVDRISHYLWVILVLGICIYRYGTKEMEKYRDSSELVN